MMSNQLRNGWQRQSSGVTLIELLLVMALLPMLLIVLAQLFGGVMDGQVRSSADSSVNQELNYIMAKLQYDVSQADSLLTPVTTGATVSAFSLEIDGEVVIYEHENQRLYRSDAQGMQPITTSRVLVEDFKVARYGNATSSPTLALSVQLASTASASQDLVRNQLQTTLGLRSAPE